MIVSWIKPDGGDEVDQYHIEWYQYNRYQSSGYKYVEHILGVVNYSFAIINLQSETKYNIWIAAKNSEGYGHYQSADITTGKALLCFITDIVLLN